MTYRCFFLAILVIFTYSPLFASQQKTVILKGNNASSYSLPSIMLSALKQPDFLELPLLLTKDNIPIVFDDVFLHPSTNVADLFPERNRQDGKYYLIDFTLAEIEQLSYREDSSSQKYTQHPVSFADSLKVIPLLFEQLGNAPQILPVIKYPWYHTSEGKDISSILLNTLIAQSGSVDAPLYLKCYDPEELQRIKKNLLPGIPVDLKLIQGIDKANGGETMRIKRGAWSSYSYDWLFTRLGLRVLSGYAEGLSLAETAIQNEETLARLITDSHALKMKVYIDVNDVQQQNTASLFERLLFTLNADGLALPNPNVLKEFLLARQEESSSQSSTTSNSDSGDNASILNDPEALSRRLQNIK